MGFRLVPKLRYVALFFEFGIILCVTYVRFLLDRYIAANQGQENSLLGNDYDLEAIADAFASWTPLLCNYAGGKCR